MKFIKLSSYDPIYDDLDDGYFFPAPIEDPMDELIRKAALGVDEQDVEVSEEVHERDIEDLEIEVYYLQLNEDNIVGIRNSNDLMNPGGIISIITGTCVHVTESAEEILLMIAEATGEQQINDLLL